MKLTEDYKEKVNAVRDRVLQFDTKYKTKEELLFAIKSHANLMGIADYRLGGKAQQDFVRDVFKLTKSSIKREEPSLDPKLLQKVAMAIQRYAGEAFPDGDPFDLLKLALRRMGVGIWGVAGFDITEILDAAAKKHLGVNSYNDYIADMWDDVHADRGHNNDELYRAMGGDEGENPWRTRNESMKNTIKEALADHDHKINNAVMSVLGVDEEKAKRISKKMSFDDYLNMAMAIDRNDEEAAKELLQKYDTSVEPSTVESVAQELHYRIKNSDNNVICPSFKRLNEMEQRAVLSEMHNVEMQKILANLRGYTTPGIYESSIFDVQLVEEIIRRIKDVKINQILEFASPNAPGKQNQAISPGASTTQQARMDPRTKVSVTNDAGEAEDGDVVSDTGTQVMVRTKKGVQRYDKGAVAKKAAEAIGEDEFGIETPDLKTTAKKHNVGIQHLLDQLGKGIKVEFEHTDDRGQAMEIALDHLAEDPNYYSKLSTIHNESDENLAEIIRLKDLAGIK